MSVEVRIRYGDFRRETSVGAVAISYSRLTRLKASGRVDLGEGAGEKRFRLTSRHLWRILAPYVGSRAGDQFRAVLPLALYLVWFQVFILRQEVAEPWSILAGMLATILGLMLFMEGLRVGLMPFGESIGHALPQRSPLRIVLFVAFLLGIGVTFAEPAIGALRAAGATVRPETAPYLFALLNGWAEALVLMVAAGVGVAAVLGMLMFIRGWSLKPLIFVSLALALGLTALAAADPRLEAVIGLAWDCGAVTTGPVTVPLVLALGIGVASAAGRGESSTAGFGIVTMASLIPVAAVLGLGLHLAATYSPQEILATVEAAGEASAWHEASPWAEIGGGLRAIVPLVLFLYAVSRWAARSDIADKAVLAYGIALALAGMIVFNLGLTYGLAALGGQSGAMVPAAFVAVSEVAGSPIFGYAVGVGVALIFAWLLGFGATLAEPALAALGMTVETLTNGAMKKSTLIHTVSTGVGTGIALGIAKLVFAIPLAWLVVPGYLLAAVLTVFSTAEFAAIAWDSAGVTTGPVTVPLVLAMGLGFGGAVGASDGFGILAMASVCPILAVLTMGLAVRRRARRLESAGLAGAVERRP